MPDNQTPSAPAEQAAQPQAEPAAQPTTTQPTNAKALEVAVQRTTALRRREEALAAREESLKGVSELADLMKKDPAAAFERIAGENYLEAYKAITNKVVGTQDEQKALDALPKSVREKLERLAELEKKVPLVDELTARLGALEEGKKKAEATLVERQRRDAAARVYAMGSEAVQKVAADLPLLMAHPEKDARIQARWVEKMRGVRSELAALSPEQRGQKGAELVLEAAREEQAALEKELGWVLTNPWARGKILGKGSKPSPAPASSAGTPANPKPPRTGTPTSLGEPSVADLRQMTHKQRVEHLKALERSGTLFTKS